MVQLHSLFNLSLDESEGQLATPASLLQGNNPNLVRSFGEGKSLALLTNLHRSRHSNYANRACPKAEDTHIVCQLGGSQFFPVSSNYPLFRRQCHTCFGVLFYNSTKMLHGRIFTKTDQFFFCSIQTNGRQTLLSFYLQFSLL